MRHICFYVSDHGFGHITRNLSIILQLLKEDDVKISLVCGQRQLDFVRNYLPESLNKRINFRVMQTDIGLVLQEGTLEIDKGGLKLQTEKYLKTCPILSRQEADWLVHNEVNVAVCDMPIWSIEACRLAGIEILYIGNFTWTELYKEHLPEYIWQAYGNEYKKLNHVALYALHNREMLQFVGAAQDLSEVSLVCRPFSHKLASDIKNKLTRPIVFVALGMSATFKEIIDVSNYPYDFIINAGVPFIGSNVYKLDSAVTNTQDYILASDYVITKAGWSTVAECILAHKPMALFERNGVLEDRNTISILQKEGVAICITQDDLFDINGIIRRMDKLLRGSYNKFYDCSSQIADKILSLV